MRSTSCSDESFTLSSVLRTQQGYSDLECYLRRTDSGTLEPLAV